MDCNWVRSKISAYKQNKLSDNEVKEFESHIEECESCQSFLASYEFSEDQFPEPNLYVEVPYIHPVTQERLYIRVLSTSAEGMLFLQEQEREKLLNKEKSLDDSDETDTLPFATIDPLLEDEQENSSLNIEREKNGNMIEQELKKEKSHDGFTIDKQLPFKYNPWKQAAFYRFTSIIVSVLWLITLFIHFFSN